MPIKNKDGSILKLSGPNPLMEGQDIWDMDSVVLHNFRWKGIVIPAREYSPPVQEVKRPPSIKEELFQPEIPITKKEEEPPPPLDPEPIPKAQEIAPVKTRLPKGLIRIHCLPASIESYVDDLYDQGYKTIRYGDPFVFEGGVSSQGDVAAIFWSTDTRVTVGSILYPISMEKRWWEVVDLEERPLGGTFFNCRPSAKQPYFDHSSS